MENGGSGFPRLALFARLGAEDLADGLRAWRIWHLLGSGELRRRYARSRVGQLWHTLSTAVSIGILAFVWSVLFKTPIIDLLPHLAVSIIFWQFLSSVVTDATNLFTVNGHLMLSQRIEGSVIVFAAVYRNLLSLAHDLVIIPIVFIAAAVPVRPEVMLALPAMALITLTAVWLSYVLGILCARFRDLANIVHAVLQLAFYVTPVLWKPGFLGEGYQWVVLVNPFAIYLDIVRAPLLGEPLNGAYWALAALTAMSGLVLGILFVGRYRRQLLYWV